MKNNNHIIAMISITITIITGLILATWAVACKFDEVKDIINDNNLVLTQSIGDLSGRVGTLEAVFEGIKKNPVGLNRVLDNIKEYAFNSEIN